MRNCLCLPCFLALLAINAVAQPDSVPLFHRANLLVKWNPLSLIDLESTLQFSGEYFVTDRNAIQAEIGYGPPFLSYGRSSLEDRQAWRFRTEYQLYRQRYPQKGRYWALEFFGLTVNGFNPVYTDSFLGGNDATVSFPIHKRVAGSHLKAGIQRTLSRSKHFYYDFYTGLGVRFVYTFAEPVDGIPYVHPVGGQFNDPYRPRGHQWLPSVVLGIKLGYRFR